MLLPRLGLELLEFSVLVLYDLSREGIMRTMMTTEAPKAYRWIRDHGFKPRL